jgi:transcriptional regulator with XRE-family HTH domain
VITENEKAYLWRKAMGLSRKRLSDMTGYSISSIIDIEKGTYRQNGNPVPPSVLKRYRTACGAVTADVVFDWYRARLKSETVVRDLTRKEA